MTVIDCVRAGWPGATEDIAEYIIWSRTPYPCGAITAKTIYKAASTARRANDHGIRLCDFCDNPATENGMVCKRCDEALKNK